MGRKEYQELLDRVEKQGQLSHDELVSIMPANGKESHAALKTLENVFLEEQ